MRFLIYIELLYMSFQRGLLELLYLFFTGSSSDSNLRWLNQSIIIHKVFLIRVMWMFLSVFVPGETENFSIGLPIRYRKSWSAGAKVLNKTAAGASKVLPAPVAHQSRFQPCTVNGVCNYCNYCEFKTKKSKQNKFFLKRRLNAILSTWKKMFVVLNYDLFVFRIIFASYS